jgi:hypothetical protein
MCSQERHIQRQWQQAYTKASTKALFPSPRKVILFYRQWQASGVLPSL